MTPSSSERPTPADATAAGRRLSGTTTSPRPLTNVRPVATPGAYPRRLTGPPSTQRRCGGASPRVVPERAPARTRSAGRRGRRRVRSGRRELGMRYLIPADLGVLQRSPLLPEPIWSDDLSFARPEALEALADLLADLPAPQEVA